MDSQHRMKTEFPQKFKKPDVNSSDFSYELPDNRIAQFPINDRDMSKLLISGTNYTKDTIFRNIDEYIPSDHLLVFNNTKVVRARIHFRKNTGASVEVFCIEPLIPSDYERSFSSENQVTWKCIIGNLKKWKKGKLTKHFIYGESSFELTAEKLNSQNDASDIRFEWNCPHITFANVLDIAGHIPLPPYINREDSEEDASRYQTIFAQVKGSVAAPTAGLHFTDLVFDKLKKKGIKVSEVTLHVGAGTFQPIKTDRIADHEMHCEHFTITETTLRKIKENAGKIIAVGTTSVRTLESLYWIGIKLSEKNTDCGGEITLGQWEPYNLKPSVSVEQSLLNILAHMKSNGISNLNCSTKIMIVPGYDFIITNGIITNFHQPGSTLLLLVAAWTGERWKEIYNYALKNDFRFLSYGDCSLLFR